MTNTDTMKIGSVFEGLLAREVLRRKGWQEGQGILKISVDGKPATVYASKNARGVWEASTMPFNFFDEDLYALDWELG